jgi:hypothetical protein
MELKQKKGKRWDHLKIDDGRLHHDWDLGRESGSRCTDLVNIDPHVGHQAKKTEGKAPYLVLAAILAALMVWATQGDAISPVFWGMLPTLFVVFLVIAFRIQSKEALSLVYLRDGSVFAVVRHDWVDAETRDAFFGALSTQK